MGFPVVVFCVSALFNGGLAGASPEKMTGAPASPSRSYCVGLLSNLGEH